MVWNILIALTFEIQDRKKKKKSWQNHCYLRPFLFERFEIKDTFFPKFYFWDSWLFYQTDIRKSLSYISKEREQIFWKSIYFKNVLLFLVLWQIQYIKYCEKGRWSLCQRECYSRGLERIHSKSTNGPAQLKVKESEN